MTITLKDNRPKAGQPLKIAELKPGCAYLVNQGAPYLVLGVLPFVGPRGFTAYAVDTEGRSWDAGDGSTFWPVNVTITIT